MAACGGGPSGLATQPTNTYPTHPFLLTLIQTQSCIIFVIMKHQPSEEEMLSPVWCDHGCLPLQTLTAPAGVSRQPCIFESPV